MSSNLPSIQALVPRFDADALIALNDALQHTPEAKLRDTLRSVCLSNLDVAVVLHGALCGRRLNVDKAPEQDRNAGDRVKHENDDEDDDEENSEDDPDPNDWNHYHNRPWNSSLDGHRDDEDDDEEEAKAGEEKRIQFAPGLYGTEYSPRDSEGNIPFDDQDVYEYNHQLMEGSEEDDEEEDEENDGINETLNNPTNRANVPVLDLTEPDADKENATAGENRNFDMVAQGSTHGQKRKASDGDVEFLYSKKAKRDFNPMAVASGIADPSTTNMERYKYCSNCSKRFDVTNPPCHDHKTGPRRTPGHRNRVCGEGYIGGDSTGEEDEDIPVDPCDCTYHSGKLRDPGDNSGWAGEGRSVVTGHMDWWKIGDSGDQVWDCCDQEAFAKGCKMGRHQVGPGFLPFAIMEMKQSSRG